MVFLVPLNASSSKLIRHEKVTVEARKPEAFSKRLGYLLGI